MKNIQPASFGTADLTSNVAITETEWTAGTYTEGQERYVGIDLYEVVASSTTDEPTAGAAKDTPTWIKIGQINRWRMFNGALHEQTVQSGGAIDVTIETSSVVNSLAVVNCDAGAAEITVTDPTDGVIYERTVSLVSNDGVMDIYDYFFAPIDRKTEFVLLDLPPYAGTEINVVLDSGTGNDTACGALAIGLLSDLGSTYLNFTLRDRFFSRRERSVYGAFLDVLSRPVAREVSFEVLVESAAASQVMKTIQDRRDLPTVFIGDENYSHSIVYGFPDEPEIEQLTQDKTRLSLTILGQT